jgi:FkbM family methyltransferase
VWNTVVVKMRLALMQRFSQPGTLMRLPWNDAGDWVFVRARTSDVQVYMQLAVQSELSGMQRADAESILDGGANIGLAAVEFAVTAPRAHIVCVEPDGENLAVLRRNVERFGDRVTVVQGALWRRPCLLQITNPHADPWAFTVQESELGEVAAFTVSELAALHTPRGRFDVVKLDIEGAESAVFSGDLSWLSHTRVLGIELHEWMVPGCTDVVCSQLAPEIWRSVRSGEYTVFLRRQ